MFSFSVFLIIYCILHSVLADPDIMGGLYHKWWYRFFYVSQSIILFVPLFVMYHTIPSEALFRPPVWLNVFYILCWVAGLWFGLYAVRSYDNGTFLGLTQLRMKMRGEKYEYEKPHLTMAGALSVVRHPYYSVSLFLIWARPLAVKDLYLNIILTIYFILGTINEERKLKEEFGIEYLEYMKSVPALIPFIKRKR